MTYWPQTTSPASAALPAPEFEYTSCSFWERYIPIFEVAFQHGLWWSISSEMSQQIYDQYKNQQNAGYTWDWGDARAGSWQPDGQQTSINRYVIDFDTWEQRNVDNDRRRSVRLVWVTAKMADPKWTREKPARGAALPKWTGEQPWGATIRSNMFPLQHQVVWQLLSVASVVLGAWLIRKSL